MADSEFWLALEHLVATSNLIIDRPKGSPHPRHASFRYPMDYGYLQGTESADGDAIDVWVGSLKCQSPAAQTVSGIIVTVDSDKRDAEFKLLVNSTPAEAQIALTAHYKGLQTGILVKRMDAGDNHTHE
jgi:inorganic pyrophosphatase